MDVGLPQGEAFYEGGFGGKQVNVPVHWDLFLQLFSSVFLVWPQFAFYATLGTILRAFGSLLGSILGIPGNHGN